MRLLLRLSGLAAILGLVLGLGTGVFLFRSFQEPGPLTADVIVRLPRGEGLRPVAEALARDGVLASPYPFVAGAMITGIARNLKAGEYRIPARASARQVGEILASGKVVVHRLTVPEGLTVREVLALVAEAEPLEGPLPDFPAEGSLLPETYHFIWGDKRAELVERMMRAMRETVAELWPKRSAELPLATPAEALVLASIVEKETGLATERPLVASVFINRLRRGMKLQSDPTVIYGITRGRAAFERPITRADLDAENAWNTYRIDGLPPSPIANPGRASIEAVLNPKTSRFLYFVADGSGGHAFAETLEGHNRNVRAWRAQQGGR